MVTEPLLLFAQTVLAVSFAMASLAKTLNFARFSDSLAQISKRSTEYFRITMSVSIILFEFMIAAMLLMPSRHIVGIGGALCAAALMLFTPFLLLKLFRSQSFICSCFGEERQVNWLDLLRNGVLLLLALWVANAPEQRLQSAADLDFLTVCTATAATMVIVNLHRLRDSKNEHA